MRHDVRVGVHAYDFPEVIVGESLRPQPGARTRVGDIELGESALMSVLGSFSFFLGERLDRKSKREITSNEPIEMTILYFMFSTMIWNRSHDEPAAVLSSSSG